MVVDFEAHAENAVDEGGDEGVGVYLKTYYGAIVHNAH